MTVFALDGPELTTPFQIAMLLMNRILGVASGQLNQAAHSPDRCNQGHVTVQATNFSPTMPPRIRTMQRSRGADAGSPSMAMPKITDAGRGRGALRLQPAISQRTGAWKTQPCCRHLIRARSSARRQLRRTAGSPYPPLELEGELSKVPVASHHLQGVLD